jgi:lysophospholipase L1-like esterase
MSIKPQITLLFFLSVLTILLVIAVLFPDSGFSISDKLLVRFASPRDIFSIEAIKYADISKILQTNTPLNDSVAGDSSIAAGNEMWDTLRADADSLVESTWKLQFPKNNKRALDKAFRAFERASSSPKPIRIMHYGDSQIEGDRITSFLRNNLQKKFGGMGVGIVPVEQPYDFSFSIHQESADNWRCYTLYGERDTSIANNRYGALASFCRFSPDYDSTEGSVESVESWVSFNSSPYSYSNTRQFQQCRIFYSHNPEPFVVELFQNDSLVDADMYPPSSSLKTIGWIFDQPESDLKIVFKGKVSPDIYGIALDGKSGIAVDNIAMRGSSGLVFSKMNPNELRIHYKELGVEMIILQFGGNVVPNITSDYTYYERLFSSQLKRIREILPDVAIIVIGVADMSIKEKDRYVSYPNIEKIRDAMKKAAYESDAVYWDMYKAMGGKNSMPSWVLANPPLASKDFVHFNARGAKIIANMFYNALMNEYANYKKRSSESLSK